MKHWVCQAKLFIVDEPRFPLLALLLTSDNFFLYLSLGVSSYFAVYKWIGPVSHGLKCANVS